MSGRKEKEYVLGMEMSYITRLNLGFMSNRLKASKFHFKIHKVSIYKSKMFSKNCINKLEAFTDTEKCKIVGLNEIYFDDYNWGIHMKE